MMNENKNSGSLRLIKKCAKHISSGSINLLDFKTKKMKRDIIFSSIFFVACFFVLSNSAYAATTPTVKVKKQKDTSVTLQFFSEEFAKKDAKIKVKIENHDNDTTTTKTFDVKFKKSGKVDVKIGDLGKDIEYSFKGALKKSSGGSYSSYSDTVKINESGDASYNAKISISDVSPTSLKLKVTSAALQKKNVKIKVRIENEDTDKTETRVFSKKLNKKGNAEFIIDGLSADTEYSLSAAIKKEKGKLYSAYTSEKKVTTD